MISKKQFHAIGDLQKLQFLATQCPSDVGIHSLDNRTIVDAKSLIGLFSLDFSEPVLVVSENADFHAKILTIGKTIPQE